MADVDNTDLVIYEDRDRAKDQRPELDALLAATAVEYSRERRARSQVPA